MVDGVLAMPHVDQNFTLVYVDRRVEKSGAFGSQVSGNDKRVNGSTRL
jgi:hypothetical protein